MKRDSSYDRSRSWKVPAACILSLLLWMGCREDDDAPHPHPKPSSGLCEIVPGVGTPHQLQKPFFFPEPIIPADNPMTEEGILLGRHLFWDNRLSRNNAVSCGSCHAPESAFADNSAKSTGLYGQETHRNSMPLFNLAWNTSFFWDGRAVTLEEQILEPIENPIEMDLSWPEAVARIEGDSLYPDMFAAAFGSPCVDSVRVTYAIAQFIRTMISAGSKFDQSHYGPLTLTPAEQRGLELFLAEGGDPEIYPGGQNGGDCFHCHGGGLVLFTDHQFHNNGIDSIFASDPGREDVTGNPYDRGKFRTPSLRNVALTAPYMHDGRFATLHEVIEHYNGGGHNTATLDPLMKFPGVGLGLSEQDIDDLVTFLESLSDENFVTDERFEDPR